MKIIFLLTSPVRPVGILGRGPNDARVCWHYIHGLRNGRQLLEHSKANRQVGMTQQPRQPRILFSLLILHTALKNDDDACGH